MIKSTNRHLAVAAVLVAALLTTGAARAQGPPEKSRVDAFKHHLAKKGFVWQEGEVWFPDILSMCCKCQLPSCYSNNASSRYGFFVLPPAPNQAPSMKNPYAEWFTEAGNLPPDWSFA
jgi:hypothetical protein